MMMPYLPSTATVVLLILCSSLIATQSQPEQDGHFRRELLATKKPTPRPTSRPSVSPTLAPVVGPRPLVPPSPFATNPTANPYGICYNGSSHFKVNAGILAIDTDMHPGSPFYLQPFSDPYKLPTLAKPKILACRNDNHCLISYEFDIVDVQLRPFGNTVPECAALPGTWFITYGGVVPAPMIVQPTGHESLLRFNNKITNKFTADFAPCLPSAGKKGRPISVHFHGSASLAPFDGWADDETCVGQTKDYVYPNNRPTTGWYHDHALHTTADNAYLGAAGMYVMTSKKRHGGCGEPWNLEDIEELPMMLADKAIDHQCQLRLGAATKAQGEKHLYGDINMVNGVPFPLMTLQPKWYRFRFLNAAAERAYLIKIKTFDSNNELVDVSQNLCKVIAGDGGYKATPSPYPAYGMMIGVAERYEVVCDFRSVAGQTLYWYNDRDPARVPKDPYFCYSHLIAAIVVEPSTPTSKAAPLFDETVPPPIPSVNHIDKILSAADVKNATDMANASKFHRNFDFRETNGGVYTINGQTWDLAKIVAADVGQNTWELWRFTNDLRHAHYIHVHLVDFFVVRRNSSTFHGVESYEYMTPKDVVFLGAGEEVYIIARFGPHKGDYMFHCHNLIHEDDDMLGAFRINARGMNSNQSSAQPFLYNSLHKSVYNNWKYSDPMLGETAARNTTLAPVHTQAYINTFVTGKRLYKIFYPLNGDFLIQNAIGYSNPWMADWCPLVAPLLDLAGLSKRLSII